MSAHYKNKHDALMRLPEWSAVVERRGIYPRVDIQGRELFYWDGSGPADRRNRGAIVINMAQCPYEAENGVCSTSREATDLYLGLIANAPALYRAMYELLMNPCPETRQRAQTVLGNVQAPTGYE